MNKIILALKSTIKQFYSCGCCWYWRCSCHHLIINNMNINENGKKKNGKKKTGRDKKLNLSYHIIIIYLILTSNTKK